MHCFLKKNFKFNLFAKPICVLLSPRSRDPVACSTAMKSPFTLTRSHRRAINKDRGTNSCFTCGSEPSGVMAAINYPEDGPLTDGVMIICEWSVYNKRVPRDREGRVRANCMS